MRVGDKIHQIYHEIRRFNKYVKVTLIGTPGKYCYNCDRVLNGIGNLQCNGPNHFFKREEVEE